MRPVIEALSAEGALVSIDTRKPAVMEAAAAAGAGIINDVTGLTGTRALLRRPSRSGCRCA